MQCNCYVNSCWHTANSSFAFWNFLELFFLVFSILVWLTPKIWSLKIWRATVLFPPLYFQSNFGTDFSYYQRVIAGQMKKVPDPFLCFYSSVRRRWLMPSRPWQDCTFFFPHYPLQEFVCSLEVE